MIGAAWVGGENCEIPPNRIWFNREYSKFELLCCLLLLLTPHSVTITLVFSTSRAGHSSVSPTNYQSSKIRKGESTLQFLQIPTLYTLYQTLDWKPLLPPLPQISDPISQWLHLNPPLLLSLSPLSVFPHLFFLSNSMICDNFFHYFFIININQPLLLFSQKENITPISSKIAVRLSPARFFILHTLLLTSWNFQHQAFFLAFFYLIYIYTVYIKLVGIALRNLMNRDRSFSVEFRV